MGKNQKIQNGGGRGSQSLGREFSAGGVVYKQIKNKKSKIKNFWLICKSNPTPDYPGDYWRLPKGWIDDKDGGLKPGPISSGKKKATERQLQETALREVREEGGVEGKIIKKISTSRYFIRNGIKFVTYYLMEWMRDLPEGFGFETEKIDWLTFEKGYERLNHAEEKKMLKKAGELLETIKTQPSLV